MLKSYIQIENRRQVVHGVAIITAASVALSVLLTYVFVRGGDETFVRTGLLISSIVPLIVAPLASAAILEVLRENFQLNKELMLAARVAERLAHAEASARARQSANEALEAELAERKRVEAELQESNRALASANTLKSRFIANINREIRAPIVEVLDLIDAFGETDLSQQQVGPFARLQRTSVALFTTINDILDLSQLEAGEVHLQAVAFDLGSCVEDCVDVFAKEAARKGVEILLHIAPSVPWRVRGDEQRLRHVLENLLANAVKFTQRGRIVVRVSASADNAGTIRFDVSDTGVGFSEQARSELFEPFGGTGASDKRGGAGLGLAISRHLVRLMNGRLSIDSQPGRGAVVSFTAELDTVDDGVEEAMAGGLRDAKVFLATSRSSTRHLIGMYLSKGGASYECTANPDDVLPGLRQGVANRTPFDAVILDLGEGNADLARSIRAHAAFDRMRVIAIASAQGEFSVRGCSTLAKPVLPDRLSHAIVGA